MNRWGSCDRASPVATGRVSSSLVAVVLSMAVAPLLTGCGHGPALHLRTPGPSGPQSVLGLLTAATSNRLTVQNDQGTYSFLVAPSTTIDGVLGAPSYRRLEDHGVQRLRVGETVAVSSIAGTDGSLTATWVIIRPWLLQDAVVVDRSAQYLDVRLVAAAEPGTPTAGLTRLWLSPGTAVSQVGTMSSSATSAPVAPAQVITFDGAEADDGSVLALHVEARWPPRATSTAAAGLGR
jgi:hypothetical protein